MSFARVAALALGVVAAQDPAADCKANALNKIDTQACDDFYTESVGVAFTMIPPETFVNGPNTPGKEPGAADAAAFLDPPKLISDGKITQALSITHFGLDTQPFQDYCDVGLVMRLGTEYNGSFYKYMQACPVNPENSSQMLNEFTLGRTEIELASKCTDGGACMVGRCEPENCHPTFDGHTLNFETVLSLGKSFSQFTNTKNVILAATGKYDNKNGTIAYPNVCECKNIQGQSDCNYATYNEFDSNGLDPWAFAGLLWWTGNHQAGYPQCSSLFTSKETPPLPVHNGTGCHYNCADLTLKAACGFLGKLATQFPAVVAARAALGKTASWPVYQYKSSKDDGVHAPPSSSLKIAFYVSDDECKDVL